MTETMYSALSPDDVPQLAPSFDAAQAFYGFAPNYQLAMTNLPLATEAFTTLLTEMYDEVTLPDTLAHLIALKASLVSQCNYSIAHSAYCAHRAGVSSEKIARITDFEQSDLYDTRERAALAFADKSAQAPSSLDKVDFEDMQPMFSETEICEILFIVAVTGFHNRWNDAISTTLEEEPRQFAEQHLPSQLWRIGKHL